jgi:L-lysine 2,3-aminomutase
LALAADEIRRSLNPQPAGQVEYNIPLLGGRPLTGCQHKYRETLLFFPAQGQTCHVYCSYCFRWAQFVDLPDLRFSAAEADDLVAYLRLHPEVQDLLITGGDPMVMKAELLGRYLRPVLAADLPGLRTIRIGTKAVASWPQRFVGEADADPMLRLFEEVVAAGRHLAVMAHYSHPIELSTPVAREAVRRIRRTGAEIRMQSPLIKHVNDDPALWRDLCNVGVALGLIPYYMFVERDTGAKRYFEMPLVQCHAIFAAAFRELGGLARTLRGPVMSTTLGKVRVLGVKAVAGRKVLVLDFLQARDPDLVGRPFFAEMSTTASWFDQLRPATGDDEPFFPLAAAFGQPLDVTRTRAVAPMIEEV